MFVKIKSLNSAETEITTCLFELAQVYYDSDFQATALTCADGEYALVFIKTTPEMHETLVNQIARYIARQEPIISISGVCVDLDQDRDAILGGDYDDWVDYAEDVFNKAKELDPEAWIYELSTV